MSRQLRAAVIGSGFGGLGAAIRLQRAGLSTVLFEAREIPGGRASVHRHEGFTFDEGPTVITAPHTLAELFELAERRMEDAVELLPVNPFYRLVWPDGDTFDYDGNGDRMLARIEARSASDAVGYRRFLRHAAAAFDKGYSELSAAPFLRFADMVRVAPHLAKLRADRSVFGTVSRFVSDEHVRQALSFHALLVGGNPLATSSIYTLIHHLERKWGVFFPRGGTSALVAALADLYRNVGGELRLSCPVEEVVVAPDGAHRVTSAAGMAEPFDVVVSNADVHHTYARLYRNHPAAAAAKRRLERADWSMSLFVLHFATNRTWDVAHHTVVFGPRYEALLREIFEGPRLPDDFSLYLHAPCVTDPALAPPGCAAFYVLSPVPHLGRADLDWERIGDGYAERILAALESVLPGLRRHVIYRRWFTPLDFRDRFHAYRGSAFSLAPTLLQSAYFRPHNRDDRIPGLYLVGAGTHPGAGVPGVLQSAKATAGLVLRDRGMEAAA